MHSGVAEAVVRAHIDAPAKPRKFSAVQQWAKTGMTVKQVRPMTSAILIVIVMFLL
jgi:hypothetical protein